VKSLCFAPVGPVLPKIFDWLEAAAREWFAFPIRRLPALPMPEGAYDGARDQYRSVEIVKALAGAAPADAARMLGVTEVDLSIPMLTFLFGHAQLSGRVALISLCRLRQEFYGLPPDEALLRERAVKEMLHEMGHTFGLTHCGDTQCAMSVSTHIQFVDAKSARYCASCGPRIAWGAAAKGVEVL
jgi:archaemetzincin